MPRLNIDLTDAVSFEPVDPGTYEMKVDEISAPERSEHKGTLGVWVYFKFLDEARDRRHGRPRRFYPTEGKGAGFWREFWKATTGEELPLGEASVSVDTDDVIGTEVIVTFTADTYEGRPTSNISDVVRAA